MSEESQALVAEVGRAMQAYQRSTDAFDDAVAARLGLNRTDLRGLDWLFDGPLAVGELGAATGLTSAATTALIDRLEQKGFVARVRDAADRRKVLIEMTAQGRQRVGAFYGPLVREGNQLLARLCDKKLEILRDHLVASRQLT